MNKSQLSSLTLLVIDDDPQHLGLVSDALEQDGVRIVTATDPEEGLKIFERERPFVVLADLKMPKLGGMELLDTILARDPATNVILMTGYYTTESAVEAIQKGALDYVTKPLDMARLRARMDSLLAEAQIRRRAAALDEAMLSTFAFEGMIGRSPAMLEVFSTVRRVAPHFQSILITGPTGCGKELIARALHSLGRGPQKRFAVCNSAAITDTLVESELFGHVRGAFTGAAQDKVGLFEYAAGGTVLLDEIGDMPLPAQAKLLRVLQNKEVQRVGSPCSRQVDVRVVAATNRDLPAMVREGKFRADLYFRLAMVEIALPPLSERREDLPLLNKHFLEKFSSEYNKRIQGITRRAQTLMARYSWPGNVRELENAIGHACMMAQSEFIDIVDLPPILRQPTTFASTIDANSVTLRDVELRHVKSVLQQTAGDKKRAAELLGISRTTLYRMLGEQDGPSSLPAEPLSSGSN